MNKFGNYACHYRRSIGVGALFYMSNNGDNDDQPKAVLEILSLSVDRHNHYWRINISVEVQISEKHMATFLSILRLMEKITQWLIIIIWDLGEENIY